MGRPEPVAGPSGAVESPAALGASPPNAAPMAPVWDVLLTAEGWPCQPFDKSVTRRVRDAWREWHEGLGTGRPSIVELDERFSSKWKYTTAIAMWYTRRKRIVEAIQGRIDRGMRENDAVEEMVKLGVAKTLNALSNCIKDGSIS